MAKAIPQLKRSVKSFRLSLECLNNFVRSDFGASGPVQTDNTLQGIEYDANTLLSLVVGGDRKSWPLMESYSIKLQHNLTTISTGTLICLQVVVFFPFVVITGD